MVSSHLPNKAAWTATGTVGWISLTALKVNMDLALCDATLVHNVQRCLEELEQCTVALEQEPCGPEEPSYSDSEAVINSDGDCYQTAGPRLAARPVVQQKVKYEQPMVQGEHPQGAPSVTEFATHQPYTQVKLVNLGMHFRKRKGNLGSMALESLLRLWDTGVDSILYSRDEIGWLTSIITHPSLRQSLQNARRFWAQIKMPS